MVTKGVLRVKGISRSGHRGILAVEIANTESEATWGELFRKLRERGLMGVLLVISDEHKGLVAAIRRYLQGAQWQRCPPASHGDRGAHETFSGHHASY